MADERALYRFIAERIRVVRDEKRLTQEQLAERAHLTRSAIANIETVRQNISVFSLWQIADALGVQPTELLPNLTVAKEGDNTAVEKILAENTGASGILVQGNVEFLKKVVSGGEHGTEE